MAKSYAWKIVGRDHPANPPTPYVEVEIPGPHGPVPVEGIFDTGADGVELHDSVRAALEIDYGNCVPTLTGEGQLPTTVVQARLDGKVFDMPVTFTHRVHNGEPINLFGRLPIMEIFSISFDQAEQLTTFAAVDGAASQRVADYEAEMNEWLSHHPEGFQVGVDYTHPSATA